MDLPVLVMKLEVEFMFKVGQVHDLPGFKTQEFKNVRVTDCQSEICLLGSPVG